MKIYETERFKGKTKVDYESLQSLADSLAEEIPESDSLIYSYARVSTPAQIRGGSLMRQHEENVREIRENFDNEIVFVTEIGSGALPCRNRLLHKIVEDMPVGSGLYAAAFDRLERDIKAFLPTARLIDQKNIWLFVKCTDSLLGADSGKYFSLRQYSLAKILENALENPIILNQPFAEQ